MLQFFHQYMLGCNYFWMLCEGIYLHTLIVVAVFAEEQRLHWYYLLGWGMYVTLCGKMVSTSRFLNSSSTYGPLMTQFISLDHSFKLSAYNYMGLDAYKKQHKEVFFICCILGFTEGNPKLC